MREKRSIAVVLLANLLLLTACGNDVSTAASGTGVDEGRSAEASGENVPSTIATIDLSEVLAQTGRDAADKGEESQTTDSMEDDGQRDVSAGRDGQEGNGQDGLEGDASDSSEIRITISAAGDVTLGNYIGQGYEASFRQTYDSGVGDGYFFENVFDIFDGDDMTLVNLEGPLTLSEDYREGQTYTISGDPEYVGILTAGSIETVSFANNHRLDYKEQGSNDTVAALEEAGIFYAYDGNYCIYEVKGIRIGIVSVNEVGQGYGVEKYLQEGIAKLREDGADLVFACCHWGIERENYPEEYQESLGKKCIDWGYDLVVGCHPHVLQGVEEYQGKFIIYSLGNFCFGANRNPADKDCMIFQQTFSFIDGEKQEDREIRVIPCMVSSVASRNDYKPTPAEGGDAERIIGRINEYSRDMGVEFDSEGYLVQQPGYSK